MYLLMTLALMLGPEAQAAGSQLTVKPQISAARGLTDFDLDGNGGWTVAGQTLVLEKAGVPGGPIRRPAALAILKSEPLTDLTLRLELRSTAPADLAVRDVQLIVGYQSPTQFYYIHLSAKTDAVHNGIFIVDNADRKRIDEPTSKAHLVDQAWHRVRHRAQPGDRHDRRVLRRSAHADSVRDRQDPRLGPRRRRLVRRDGGVSNLEVVGTVKKSRGL